MIDCVYQTKSDIDCFTSQRFNLDDSFFLFSISIRNLVLNVFLLYSKQVCCKWWLLVPTLGFPPLLYWDSNLENHLQYVILQIWCLPLRYVTHFVDLCGSYLRLFPLIFVFSMVYILFILFSVFIRCVIIIAISR